MDKIEYRVRPVTRYVVTRWYNLPAAPNDPDMAQRISGCAEKGEFDNPDIAYQVAYALAKDEHDRLGWPPGDERIMYPSMQQAA